jgi:erythritol transport system permease protein
MSEMIADAPKLPTARGRSAGGSIAELLLKLRSVLALAMLVILFSSMTSSFFTTNNLSILTKHVAITALLAVGTSFVILAGGIDLSVGSVAGLSGMIAGYLILHGIVVGGEAHFLPVWAVVLAALGGGVAVGFVNGVLVTRCSIAPFIATLGTLYVARGAAMLISNGATFPELAGEAARHNTGLPSIGQGYLLGVPGPVWMMAGVALAAWVLAAKTPFGRHVYAIGGNERAAMLCGIEVRRVKVWTYVISGACAALVGVIIASQLEAAHPATGQSFELNAIAAVVLGGTSLLGGRGSIGGSLIGAFVIGVLADGLVMLGVSEFWQMVIKGVVIILAVAVDQLQNRLQLRMAGAGK